MTDIALFQLSLQGDYQGLSTYLQNGGDANALLNNETALFHLRSPTCAKLIIEKGVDINHQNDLGITALHLSLISDAGLLFESLMRAGADPTLKSQNGMDAMDYAKAAGLDEFIPVLEREILRRNINLSSNKESEAPGL